MPRDHERAARLREALERAGLAAVVCALPEDVRMLTGYWPVVGTSVAVFTRQERLSLIVPKDEAALAGRGWADEVVSFEPGSLDRLTSAEEAVVEPLARVCRKLRLEGERVGYEGSATFEASSYAATHLYGAAMIEILRKACSGSALENATPLLTGQRARLSGAELETLRAACGIVAQAFVESADRIRAGMSEREVAALFAAPLSVQASNVPAIDRAGGFCWCMSGPNSADASFAFARSRSRRLATADLVLVHCNSYADGLWTDVTRTYTLGQPEDRARRAYKAIFAARDATLAAIRPGVTGADVDRAARETLRAHGFEREFRHGTGHGVGLAAINHDARPRIHPMSPDILEPGMVFNVEPAIYDDGWGGIRHCDVVAVTASGAEVLTPFQASVEDLVLPG
jgi:Xaa-Pro aminopeptidase/Xaa-Pro dipeptidase